MDKVIQGNVANIIFLKSTDDSLIDTLQKMSGTTHKSYIDSKNVTRDMERLWFQNEGKVTYTMSTKEQPVLSYNDLAFIQPQNSIVFRAGDPIVWNRNQTILPMSWQLFGGNNEKSVHQFGREYNLQTIPTLSNAIDFDVRRNTPDFINMLNKRIAQAVVSKQCQDDYKNAFGYTDHDVSVLNIDIWADDVMTFINRKLNVMQKEDAIQRDKIEDNTDLQKEIQKNEEAQRENDKPRYCLNWFNEQSNTRGLARSDLVNHGSVSHSLDTVIIKAYRESRGSFEQDPRFRVQSDGLYAHDGTPYIKLENLSSERKKVLADSAKNPDKKVYMNDMDDIDMIDAGGRVYDTFYLLLAKMDSWDSFLNGTFEDQMVQQLRNENA